MVTMFEGTEEELERRFEEMPVREFLEKLLRDDVVDQIVSDGTILVLEWTSAVKRPCRMIGFGILRDMETSKNVFFAGAKDQGEGKFFAINKVCCDRKMTGISVDELMDWIKPLNIPAADIWAYHIMEAKEQSSSGRSDSFLPLRFCIYPINSAL
ncbi:MAG: hypothetical protein WC663_05915 [Patescibacteria group bacterium]